MKTFIAFIFLVFLSNFALAQSAGKASLLFTNCAAGESTCYTNELYRYNFANGRYVGKELVISSKTADVNFGHGGNQVYQNRYALTQWGDIVDIKEKKVLHVGDGKLFRTEGSKIYMEVNNENLPEGLYIYDLVTGKYGLVQKAGRSMFFGELSPNGLRSASIACFTNKGCGLQIIEGSGKRKFFKGEFKAAFDADESTSSFLKTPLVWVDDELVLTQKKNGELVTVDMRGKVTPLLQIEIDGVPDQNPELFRDRAGNIVYQLDGDDYIIDVKNKTFKDKEYGSEFGYVYSELVNDLKNFHERKNTVGEFSLGGGVYINDYWAVKYTGKGENLGNPKGVKVYSKQTKEWTTLEIPRASEFVGWIEE